MISQGWYNTIKFIENNVDFFLAPFEDKKSFQKTFRDDPKMLNYSAQFNELIRELATQNLEKYKQLQIISETNTTSHDSKFFGKFSNRNVTQKQTPANARRFLEDEVQFFFDEYKEALMATRDRVDPAISPFKVFLDNNNKFAQGLHHLFQSHQTVLSEAVEIWKTVQANEAYSDKMRDAIIKKEFMGKDSFRSEIIDSLIFHSTETIDKRLNEKDYREKIDSIIPTLLEYNQDLSERILKVFEQKLTLSYRNIDVSDSEEKIKRAMKSIVKNEDFRNHITKAVSSVNINQAKDAYRKEVDEIISNTISFTPKEDKKRKSSHSEPSSGKDETNHPNKLSK